MSLVSAEHSPYVLFSTIYLFYQPNMYSIALLTRPVFLVGVLVPGSTLFSS